MTPAVTRLCLLMSISISELESAVKKKKRYKNREEKQCPRYINVI